MRCSYYMWLIPYIIYALALLLLSFTYRFKNRFLFWLFIFLPPLFLLPLFVLPIRNPIIMAVLLPVLALLPGSIVMILYRIFQFFRRGCDRSILVRLIRPTIVVSVFVGAFLFQGISKRIADADAVSLAKQLQADARASGYCAPRIDGWEQERGALDDSYYSKSVVSHLGIPYTLSYTQSEDGKGFKLTLSHGFNMGLVIFGGVDKELSALTFDEEHETPFGIVQTN